MEANYQPFAPTDGIDEAYSQMSTYILKGGKKPVNVKEIFVELVDETT